MSVTPTITVECDSPRHARGKVAKVAVYLRNPADGRWFRTVGNRGRAWERRKASRSGAALGEKLTAMLAPDADTAVCKLCGAQVRNWSDAELRPVLDSVYHAGERAITIRRLNALVSNGKGS